MDPSIRNAIARIDVGASRGTGFLVADGLVLTALHVVADRRQPSLTPYPGEIVLSFPGCSVKATIHETCWDAQADFAMLKFVAPAGLNGNLRPLPLAELRQDDANWFTFGFPDANPEGLMNTGQIRNRSASFQGNAAFQLFSVEAAAGAGEPVKGFSGGPVLVGNAVIGLLRFALMADNKTVAGTLYACPVASILKKAEKLLPVPDPCFGLPGLPQRQLPAEPFRHLAWFTEKEAEVFFGRNREIGEMYRGLTADDTGDHAPRAHNGIDR